ncbi:MAG: hypothetical protein FWC59_03950 [Actinomycetia bacterium]|nr:hypothetical protein [Actinomycetes bacterium]
MHEPEAAPRVPLNNADPDEAVTAAKLRYMLQHNEHHLAELAELQTDLVALGQDEAGQLVRQAGDCYRDGNELLRRALADGAEH